MTNQDPNMKFSFFHSKWLALSLHFAAWIILFIVPFYHFTFGTGFHTFFIFRVYLRTLIYIAIFYINYFLLIPKLLFKDKRIMYYLLVTVVIVGSYFINDLGNNYIFNRPEFRPEREIFNKISEELKLPRNPRRFDIYNFLFTSVLISGFSIGLKMLGRYNENEKRRKELEKEKLNSELALLKNQISPHFFFNTLNNIYSLIEIDTGNAQEAILHLSKMMRYLLYESERGNTLLSREIDFMRNYIELMKLKINEKVLLEISFPNLVSDISIPPLLFISFIENAFKHGISYNEPSSITIEMEVNNNQIKFLCNNTNFNKSPGEQMSECGVGLENIQKRLKLLFPAKHRLQINDTKDKFDVQLTIELI